MLHSAIEKQVFIALVCNIFARNKPQLTNIINMANKRMLKKQLNEAGSEMFAECMAAYLDVHDDDLAQLDSIMTTILKTHNEFVKRVSFPEPGMKPKKYYQILWNEFQGQVEEIRDNIKALV